MQKFLNLKDKTREQVVEIVSSLIILLTLTAKWEVIYEKGINSHLADFFNRLSFAFSFENYSDIFVFIGILFLIKKLRSTYNGVNKPALITSVILALIYIFSVSFMVYESVYFINKDWFQRIYAFILFIGTTLIIYYILRALEYLLDNMNFLAHQSEEINSFFHKHTFIISFLLIVFGWSIWIACVYPGIYNIDAIYQLSQYYTGHTSMWTTHHPPLSTFIMGTLIKIGTVVFKSADFGSCLYLILQTVVGALIIAYGIVTLQKEFRVKDQVLIAMVLFFAFVPFWGVYAALFEKSLFYSEFATLITIIVLPIVKDRKISNKRMIALCLTCILTALLRNNGIYAIVPTLIALIIFLKGIDRRRIILTFVIVIGLYSCVNHVIYPSLGIQKGSIAEALSLPFQQTAKYVKIYWDEVTEEEKEAIDAVLVYDSLPQAYDHNISNPVKDNYRGDNSKLGNYLKVWFKMFFKHPGIYFSAFMDSSYGYIAPINQSIEATTDYVYTSSKLEQIGLTKQANPRGVEFSNAIRSLSLNMPLIKYLSMPGLYTWLLILAIIALMMKREYGVVLAFIPSVINVLVCLASPLSTSMRYSFPAVASVPFLIGAAVYYLQKKGID